MSLIEQYIIAMANLYGAFEIEDLIDLYNTHNEASIDKETVHAIPDLEARLEKRYIYFEDEMFISQAVYPDDLFTELMDEKTGRPTYIPDKEELLKYQDEAYFNQSEALDEWIRLIRRHGNKKALLFFDDVLLSSCMALKMGWDAEETLKDLERSQYRFDVNKKQVVRHLKKLQRHLRRWEYNGHTLAELNAMKKQDAKKKIGRNDPCPCGSGKKYKHCCLNP